MWVATVILLPQLAARVYAAAAAGSSSCGDGQRAAQATYCGAAGRLYLPHYGVVQHDSGTLLVSAPMLLHRARRALWQWPTSHGGPGDVTLSDVAGCGCEWPSRAVDGCSGADGAHDGTESVRREAGTCAVVYQGGYVGTAAWTTEGYCATLCQLAGSTASDEVTHGLMPSLQWIIVPAVVHVALFCLVVW
jgi:hypothetical protein